eukprot:1276692-Pyramimonas_sp.AAC.1
MVTFERSYKRPLFWLFWPLWMLKHKFEAHSLQRTLLLQAACRCVISSSSGISQMYSKYDGSSYPNATPRTTAPSPTADPGQHRVYYTKV